MKMNTQQPKTYGKQQRQLQRQVHGNTGLPKKDRNISNLTLHQQELEEQQQTKPRVSRRKEIIKIRAELNDIDRC